MNRREENFGEKNVLYKPCALCEKSIYPGDDHIDVFVEEYISKEERILVGTTVCSELCLKKCICEGIGFTVAFKNYSEERQQRSRKEPLESGGFEVVPCCYCGKLIQADEDYHLDFSCDGIINGEGAYVFITSFCSKKCADKALSLGQKYLDFAENTHLQDKSLKEMAKETP
jgi:hypothetical protein